MALTLLASACTGGSKPAPAAHQLPFARGGTLRLTLFGWMDHEFGSRTDDGKGDYSLDPQNECCITLEMFRCCLLRTLMSYNGQATADGGALPRSDLAAGQPMVSPNGLTWTFRIKHGLHYAPPFQKTEITAPDFIRSLERGLSPSLYPGDGPGGRAPIDGNYDYLYWVIRGAKDYEDGKVDTISGLEAPDPHTLIVHLTQPSGDLPYRLAMPETAPIPPSPTDPGAPMGAAAGHEAGYGRFLVASGPYMIEGSQNLDFSKPPPDQRPVAGYVPGISLTLVRNPSWKPATDPLRAAYPDRIEMNLDTAEQAHDREAADFQAGRIDIGYFAEGAADAAHEHLLPRYLADPKLRPRLYIYPADFEDWLSMNLAMAPFDDIHVRRAVNLIVDKSAIQRANGGHVEADPAGHLAWDSLENNILVNYDPYGTASHTGDLARARDEMRQSRYDANHDGRCDARACASVRMYFFSGDPFQQQEAHILRQDLARIGLILDPKFVPFDQAMSKEDDPRSHTPIATDGTFKDFPSGSSFFQRFVADPGPDRSLIGATSDQLRQWGYTVRSVPNVSHRFDSCVQEVGLA
ncbi:MAG TPA: ABC transporter substrate-binding protein, partial [Actinomycetota bacterium]